MYHTNHDGNIRCLEPVEPFANQHDNHGSENEESQDKEEPEEPLGIVTEVTAIVFLVSVTYILTFLNKHCIDFTNMFLHLANHPFVFLVKLLLNLLPIGISHLHRNLQFAWGILYNVINMSVDIVNLDAYGINGSV